MIYTDQNGTDHVLFASQVVEPTGTFIDLVVREDVADVFETAAQVAGLATGETDEGETIWASGVSVSYLGGVVTKPVVIGEADTVIEAAQVDPRRHFNIRMQGTALAAVDADTGLPRWVVTCLAWQGGAAASANNHEVGFTLHGVTLIDPGTIDSPARRWAT